MIKLVSTVFIAYGLVGVAFVILMTKLFYPHHRLVASILYAISWIPFVYYSLYHRRVLVNYGKSIWSFVHMYWVQCLFLLLLAAFIYTIFILVPLRESELVHLSKEELALQIDQDLRSIAYINGVFTQTLNQITNEGLLTATINDLNPDQIKQLRNQWYTFVETMFELDILQQEYQGFYQIDKYQDESGHVGAFLVAYSAHLAQYRHTLVASSLIGQNTALISMLNEASVNESIPENMYTRFKSRLTNPNEILRLNAGRAYLALLQGSTKDYTTYTETIHSQLKDIEGLLANYPRLLVQRPFEFFERYASKAWFPVQKNIALQISYIRGTSREYFIQPSMIQPFIPQLQPMDVLLERRNWHATNVGIPGFWPHIALYLGTLPELDAYFAEVSPEPVSKTIQKKYPEVYALLLTNDEDGFPYRVIESKRPGVILTSLEHSANADSVAAIRPLLTKEQKLEAVFEALSHYGKPYDYNFDFSTANALVCSELAYRALNHRGSIRFTTKTVNGRTIVPPNDFAKKFAEEFGTPSQQFDFVFFIATSEQQKEATVRTLDEFLLSHTWSKWEVLQD